MSRKKLFFENVFSFPKKSFKKISIYFSSPTKKSARVPGPECAPMTEPMSRKKLFFENVFSFPKKSFKKISIYFSSPTKKSARVPGPECAPMTEPT